VSIEIRTTGAPRKTGALESSRAQESEAIAIASSAPIEGGIETGSRRAGLVARGTDVV
jgi:hypothetical protein